MPALSTLCESCTLVTLHEQITPDPREPYETYEQEELEF